MNNWTQSCVSFKRILSVPLKLERPYFGSLFPSHSTGLYLWTSFRHRLCPFFTIIIYIVAKPLRYTNHLQDIILCANNLPSIIFLVIITIIIAIIIIMPSSSLSLYWASLFPIRFLNRNFLKPYSISKLVSDALLTQSAH